MGKGCQGSKLQTPDGMRYLARALTLDSSSSSSSSQYSSSYSTFPYERKSRSPSPRPVSPSPNRCVRSVKGSPEGELNRCAPARATIAARWNSPLAWGGRAAAQHDETTRRQSPSMVRNPVAGIRCGRSRLMGWSAFHTLFEKGQSRRFVTSRGPWSSATSLNNVTSEMT